MKRIRSLLTFYSYYCVASLVITFACAWIVFFFGMSGFAFLFWLKVFTLVIIFFFIKAHKENEFYYYLNLGISKRFLWTTTLLFDMALFIGISILTTFIG